jgi:hypothetical protein
MDFLLQDIRQNRDPIAQLGRRLNFALVFMLGLVAAYDLAHRPARHRQGAHNLLDRAVLLKIGAAYLADQVHADHPHKSFQAIKGQRKDADTSRQKGVIFGRENHPSGGHYCMRFYSARQLVVDARSV